MSVSSPSDEPVLATSDKPFSGNRGRTVERTHCPLDCPDSCALDVTVEDGQLVAVHGSTEHPDTDGFICSKVTHFGRRLHHADRLTEPLERVGAKGAAEFRPISWEAALDRIVERFSTIRKEHGGEAIVPFHYGGSNGVLTDSLFDRRFFARLGASQLDKTICAAPTTAVAIGMYGKMPGVAFKDYLHAEAILIWGANPKASNIHLVPYLRQAKNAGAFVAVVDPHLHFGANEVDLHLPVLPGTDLPVALAMIAHWERTNRLNMDFLHDRTRGSSLLLERARGWTMEKAASVAGVDAGALRELADRYAEAQPAVLRCGWGLERNRNGGQAVAAILAMPALLGKFGVRGGGYTMSNSGANSLDTDAVIGPIDWTTRHLNMTQLGQWLSDTWPSDEALGPPVHGLFVYNANPVATVPDQNAVLRGLEREDLFTVVHEQVMTDTALYADIVLPAVTFLEGRDVRAGYGSYVVGGVRPVVDRVGTSRSNMELFQSLEQRFGWLDEADVLSDIEAARRAAEHLQMRGRKPDPDRIVDGLSELHDFPGEEPIQFETVVPATIDGRANLCPRVLGNKPYAFAPPADDPQAEQYPLTLISPGSSKMISSTFGESYGTLELSVHPDEAARRSLSAGDTVRVFNGLGEVVCALRLDKRLRPGVAHLPKGTWFRSAGNRAGATALCPDHVNVVAEGACFNDARVEFEKAS